MTRLIVEGTIGTTKEQIPRINLAIQGPPHAFGLDLALQDSANNTATKIKVRPTFVPQLVSKLYETTAFIPVVPTFSIIGLPAQRLRLFSRTSKITITTVSCQSSAKEGALDATPSEPNKATKSSLRLTRRPLSLGISSKNSKYTIISRNCKAFIYLSSLAIPGAF